MARRVAYLEVSPSTKRLVERCCKKFKDTPNHLIRWCVCYAIEPSKSLGRAASIAEGFMFTIYDGFTAGDDKLGIRLISHMAHFMDANARLLGIGNPVQRKRLLLRLDRVCEVALKGDPKEKRVSFSLTTKVLYAARPFFEMAGLVSARHFRPTVWGKRFARMFKAPKLGKLV